MNFPVVAVDRARDADCDFQVRFYREMPVGLRGRGNCRAKLEGLPFIRSLPMRINRGQRRPSGVTVRDAPITLEFETRRLEWGRQAPSRRLNTRFFKAAARGFAPVRR
jgi:hypothetical protein